MKSFNPASSMNAPVNAQSNIVPFQVNRRSRVTSAFWSRFWDGLFSLLIPSSDPQITQIRQGGTTASYHVYDPITGQTKTFGSELETRIWLDQRFYDNPKNW